MGISHLKKIERMFQSNPNVEYTKSYIQNKLNMNYNTICEAIDYLFFAKKIEKTKKGFKLKKLNIHSQQNSRIEADTLRWWVYNCVTATAQAVRRTGE